ncbi:hypothetical protein SmJEL517_g04678 [Synchytrium microbalum]|uniref:Uncharacterized protein n=1 Tax=Synchytrium microbalum TaxID=1806994 RepID=A0A507BSZ5_9FUNG|nr:uncharacterized protein SmJEL517_g04678 [Synchytrium microbalum]TPX32167.1 hypothetical protein SmJEL517_g04678 [Synchytrium microbalum]
MERAIVTDLLASHDERAKLVRSQYLTGVTTTAHNPQELAALAEADLGAPKNRQPHVFSPISSVSENSILETAPNKRSPPTHQPGKDHKPVSSPPRWKSDHGQAEGKIRELEQRIRQYESDSHLRKQTKPPSKLAIDDLKDAHQKVELLMRENDLLVDQAAAARDESEKIRGELEMQARELYACAQDASESRATVDALQAQLEDANKRAARADADVAESLQLLEETRTHNESVQLELKKCSGELKSAQFQISERQRAQEEITARYQAAVREANNVASRERDLAAALQTTDGELRALKHIYSVLKSDFDGLNNAHDDVLRVTKKQESRIAEVESQLVDLNKAEQRALEQAEESKLEREKSLVREQQAQSEVQRLCAKLEELPKKIKEKTEAELAAVKAQHAADRTFHAQELTSIQTELADLKNLADRAIREKRSAETELEKLTTSIPTESNRVAAAVEDLSGRLRVAERERADAVTKLETLHQRLSREETRFESERITLTNRAEEAFRRLRRVERELEETKEDRVTLLSKVADVEHQFKALEEQKMKGTHQAAADINSLHAKYETQVCNLTSKLQHTSESHSKTCKELQELLSEQRRTGERWKDESARLSTQYSSALQELQSRLAKSEARLNESDEMCAAHASRIRDLTAQITEDRKLIARLQQTLRDSDSKVAEKDRSIRDLQRRCLDAAEERKRLQRELDRTTLERDRAERDRTFQAKHGARNARLGLIQPTQDDADHFALEANVLQAEIIRVHKRSQQGSKQHTKSNNHSDSEDDSRLSGTQTPAL